VNRKRHHSIQLQAICDARCKFIHCYAGIVGSVHDARVLRLSEVNDYLNDEHKFPNESHLVGDAAYPLHKHLLTPYRDNGHLSARQKNYNFCHSSARIAIERAFGLLKKKISQIEAQLFSEGDTVKTLGLAWNPSQDSLKNSHIKVSVAEAQQIVDTKRSVLSTIAQIYDPIGLISPVTVTAKLIMQELWRHNLEWDEALSRELQVR
ncbi:protein ALP1-like, partial [Ctenocephalides felis]|uniref:protein ALP1-like n=1 Tax=Ctenocephalides felis TaxID=7515 RepID=UPI000E6E295F